MYIPSRARNNFPHTNSQTQKYTTTSPKTDFYLFDMSSRGKIIQIEFRFKPEKSKIGLSVPDWN